MGDQRIQAARLLLQAQADDNPSGDRRRQTGLRQQHLGAAHQEKEHPQAQLQLQALGLPRQPLQHQHQQPAGQAADQHSAAQAQQQERQDLIPLGEITQGQLQQQQRKHRPHRLQDQPLRLQDRGKPRHQAHLLHEGRDHRGAGSQGDRTKDPSQRPGQPRQLMGQERAAREPQQTTGEHQLQDRPLQVSTGQTQIQAAIEEHQADQQPHQGLQPASEGFGLHPIEAGIADQETRRQQHHHRWPTAQMGEQPREGTGKEGKAPDQLRGHRHRGRRRSAPLGCLSQHWGAPPDIPQGAP